MPAPEKRAWKTQSVDGGLLFVLFFDKIYHPDSYSAVEIFDNPLLPFQVYSRKNFKTYCQTAANRAKAYSEFGTGLSQNYKELISEARREYKDVLSQLKQHLDHEDDDEDEDDDESFHPDAEEDVEFNPSEFEEDDLQSLSDLIQNARLDARHDRNSRQHHQGQQDNTMPAQSTPSGGTTSSSRGATSSARGRTTSQTSGRVLTILDPYIVPYPNMDKVLGQIPMRGNVEEDDGTKLEVHPWKTEVWSKVPKELQSAYALLGESCRANDNAELCPHTMVLQAAIEERLKVMDVKRDDQGDLWVKEHELAHPFETLTDFYDKDGTKMEEFYIQANDFGYHYCQFWLKAVPKQKEKPKRRTGKRVGKAKRDDVDDVASMGCETEYTEVTVEVETDAVGVQGMDVVTEEERAAPKRRSSEVVSDYDYGRFGTPNDGDGESRPQKLQLYEDFDPDL